MAIYSETRVKLAAATLSIALSAQDPKADCEYMVVRVYEKRPFSDVTAGRWRFRCHGNEKLNSPVNVTPEPSPSTITDTCYL